MKRYQRVCVSAIVAAATINASGAAYAVSTRCYKSGTMIVFSNGMFTSFESAVASREDIKVAMSDAGKLKDDYRFDVAYNLNENAASEFQQVVDQRTTEEILLAVQNALAFGEAPEWVNDLLTQAATNLAVAQQAIDADLQEQLIAYRRMIAGGNRVVVVSHSQGNFYANLAWERLHPKVSSPGFDFASIPPRSMRLVGVASQTNRVNGDTYCWTDSHAPACPTRGRYTNFDVDRTVIGVSLVFSSTLLPNVMLPEAYQVGILKPTVPGVPKCDTMAHGFQSCYMMHPPTRSRLVSHIDATIGEMQQPARTDISGLITADISWDGAKSDLDLHVIEPDGVEIAWNHMMDNEVGSGFIAYDSKYGSDETSNDENGQESYVAGCDALKLGDYKVGVQYYDGITPTEALILNVKVGNGGKDSAGAAGDGVDGTMTTTVRRDLLRSRPSDPLQILCNVNVSTTPERPNEYRYVVTPL